VADTNQNYLPTAITKTDLAVAEQALIFVY